jgi:DNA adenine methylase
MSVLRYPGGKSRAVDIIAPFLARDEIYSPFFGGGSVELHMASIHGTVVHANDVYGNLIKFWKALKSSKLPQVIKRIEQLVPIQQQDFIDLKKRLETGTLDVVQGAAAFFVIIKAAFNGDMHRNGYSHAAAHCSLRGSIERLRKVNLTKVHFTNADYKRFLNRVSPEGFIFADPPYALDQASMLYGYHKKGMAFDHETLRDMLMERKRWVLCYNDCKYIRKLYKGCKILKANWYQSMAQRTAQELIIMPKEWYKNTLNQRASR